MRKGSRRLAGASKLAARFRPQPPVRRANEKGEMLWNGLSKFFTDNGFWKKDFWYHLFFFRGRMSLKSLACPDLSHCRPAEPTGHVMISHLRHLLQVSKVPPGK